MSKKQKFRVKKLEIAAFEPFVSSVYGFLFIFMDLLKLIWRFIVKGTMRSLSIVKFYVIITTFCELLLGFVMYTIDLFSLHERKKRLHDSIVMGLAWSRERLDNLVHA